MKPTKWLIPIFLTSTSVFSPWGHAKEEFFSTLEYKVTSPKGDFYGTVDGETAYRNWQRGAFDREQMVEIRPKELPSDLPPAVVVHFAENNVNDSAKGQVKAPILTGEEKVFMRIAKDEQRARCVLLGQKCEAFLKPEDTDSVYYRPIEMQQKNRKVITPEEK
ncbi:hypothetical protein [Neptuniibacter sp. 2_MG-2023]|jgi:hypothetical protein|uniref:hypothetical protein n=1 Tax=Neptuniibacter sp. 2_MG-2023 TaxID=3062671 RepID=UPI0026E1D12F|nr:hypothetical protein [Neptuniibacter sp. 2_MG-2023]MDO6512816.1 hypothetical protein [Neptuniibacter sp. 2_MG-2023]